MALWKNDEDLYQIAKKELSVALVGDLLDKLGFRYQFIAQNIKPVSNDMVIIGRAKTVVECDVDKIPVNGKDGEKLIKEPFGLMFMALDSLKPNEVYVCDGASYDYALWGGLMSTRAMHLGATGALVNGFHRDTNEILKLGFPTFSMGSYAQDQGPRGKVVDYDCPIRFSGIKINPGDLIYGDRDGVIIVPDEVVTEAFSGAIEKARGEKTVQKALESGMSSMDAFKKYGIM